MTSPTTTDNVLLPALEWLAQAPIGGLARKLVAARTHDPAIAQLVEAELLEIERQVDELGPDVVAHQLADPDVAQDQLLDAHLVLATAAAADQVPLWVPPSCDDRRDRRVLTDIEAGLLRLVATGRHDRIVPVALADKGVTTRQMAAVDHHHFRSTSDGVTVGLPACGSYPARTVQLGAWSWAGIREHLDCAATRGRQPCYGGQHTGATAIANAIEMRIRRVLDDAGIPATTSSLRLTSVARTLEHEGPVIAMRAGGFTSITAMQRFVRSAHTPRTHRGVDSTDLARRRRSGPTVQDPT